MVLGGINVDVTPIRDEKLLQLPLQSVLIVVPSPLHRHVARLRYAIQQFVITTYQVVPEGSSCTFGISHSQAEGKINTKSYGKSTYKDRPCTREIEG